MASRELEERQRNRCVLGGNEDSAQRVVSSSRSDTIQEPLAPSGGFRCTSFIAESEQAPQVSARQVDEIFLGARAVKLAKQKAFFSRGRREQLGSELGKQPGWVRLGEKLPIGPSTDTAPC